ncbi:MAG TPA: 50S ribosomal protein L34 [Patescibacteria group bacterium]|nr:50S ribosomal protein L34 [Patescibacteria group bacterium]
MEKLRKLKKIKRKRKHGFITRSASYGGRKVLQRRRKIQRKKLAL